MGRTKKNYRFDIAAWQKKQKSLREKSTISDSLQSSQKQLKCPSLHSQTNVPNKSITKNTEIAIFSYDRCKYPYQSPTFKNGKQMIRIPRKFKTIKQLKLQYQNQQQKN